MRYLPEWFPGAGFKTFTRVARGKFDMAIDGPLAYVKESMVSLQTLDLSAWIDRVFNARSLTEAKTRPSLGRVLNARHNPQIENMMKK